VATSAILRKWFESNVLLTVDLRKIDIYKMDPESKNLASGGDNMNANQFYLISYEMREAAEATRR